MTSSYRIINPDDIFVKSDLDYTNSSEIYYRINKSIVYKINLINISYQLIEIAQNIYIKSRCMIKFGNKEEIHGNLIQNLRFYKPLIVNNLECYSENNYINYDINDENMFIIKELITTVTENELNLYDKSIFNIKILNDYLTNQYLFENCEFNPFKNCEEQLGYYIIKLNLNEIFEQNNYYINKKEDIMYININSDINLLKLYIFEQKNKNIMKILGDLYCDMNQIEKHNKYIFI